MIDDNVDERLATGRLTIDLDALVANWSDLAALSPGAATGAAVKADAYGLGLNRVATALAVAGCRHFFSATAAEAVALRKVIGPEPEIFVLAGLTADAAPFYRESALTPVVNSRAEADTWSNWCRIGGMRMPCALHVDTGMNRLGMEYGDAERFAESNAIDHSVTLSLVMSHLACADDPDHPMNTRQRERFVAIADALGGIRRSLANSGGIFLGPEYHFDVTRPGYALYGGNASIEKAGKMKPVVTLEGRILQVRSAKKGETVGYGATRVLDRDSRIAIAGVGYSDGVMRSSSGSGVPMRELAAGAAGFIGGRQASVIGRISMDLTAFDVTDIPSAVLDGHAWIELIGPNCSLDDFAQAAGTIGYEVLTGLGRRMVRHYVGKNGAVRQA